MQVPHLLLETLEDLLNEELQMLKWYLSLEVLEGCRPIPKSRLEKASRTDIVSRMIDSYGEESAVNITVEILRKMNFNSAAEELKTKYAGAVDVISHSNQNYLFSSCCCFTCVYTDSLTICNFASAGGKKATPSTSSSAVAPPAATMSAQQGSVIFAPTVAGSTSGTWNITINK